METTSKHTRLYNSSALVVMLLGVAVAITHLVLVDRSGDTSLLPLSVIFWLSVGSLLWQKRHTLKLEKNLLSTLAGGGLLVIFFILGIQLPTEAYLAASPFIAMLGISLLAAGWKCHEQYRAELLLMFFFGVPKALLWPILDLRGLTARFSTTLLTLFNFDAVRQGRFISLPTGSVEVIHDCSGLNGILYLVAMSALFLVMLPVSGWKKYVVPFIGIGIAFLSNAARVAFLTVAAANPDPKVFEFWHGTSFFSLGALGLFSAMYVYLMWQDKATEKAR